MRRGKKRKKEKQGRGDRLVKNHVERRWNQSIVQQFTREGNMRRRVRKASHGHHNMKLIPHTVNKHVI